MDYIISEKVIFSEGIKNAAIYDLKNKKIYSINDTAKDIISRLIVHGGDPESKTESDYLSSLITHGLYNKGFITEKFKLDQQYVSKLNFVWLEITQSCNLKCLHCYEGETHKQSINYLLTNDWINIIRVCL